MVLPSVDADDALEPRLGALGDQCPTFALTAQS
jgi:hypothetical protein